MTKRIDPDRADSVLSALQAANPIPKGARDMGPDHVESLLLQVMERTEMVQDISTKRSETEEQAPARRRRLAPWLGFAAGFALAALVAVPVFVFGFSGVVPRDPALEGLPASQAETMADIVQAINDEDFDAFRSPFGADGAAGFHTGIHRPYHQGVEGGQPIPVTDAEGFEADFRWGAALDRRVDPRSCRTQSERIVSCEVAFSLVALRMGGIETLTMVFDESGQIALLSSELAVTEELGPQPLDIVGLNQFKTWLEETRPDEYRRLVEPGTPGSISGVDLSRTLTFPPRNPDLVPELTALIDEYLATR
ncbi:MAG: hypothetical protein ACRDZM_11110 [Acidimicrobiia bacterium]